jgi:hypothetical protein
MFRKLFASGVVVLALGAGVAYAATQITTSDGTAVCVNQVNGLMRVATACREGEYPLTIGGAGGGAVASSGTFKDVPWGTTSAGVALPLTGVTVAGKCDLQPAVPPYPYEVGLARLLVTSGTPMAAFAKTWNGTGTLAGTSLLTDPAATAGNGAVNAALGGDTLVAVNSATATITFGAQVNAAAKTCTYYWQAIENSD